MSHPAKLGGFLLTSDFALDLGLTCLEDYTLRKKYPLAQLSLEVTSPANWFCRKLCVPGCY